jgi:hypothetical protein
MEKPVTVPPTIHLALSPRAAQLVRDAVNYERWADVVTVAPDELDIFRAVTAELDTQLGALAPATPVAQQIAAQMAAAGAAAVLESTKERTAA